AWSIQEKSIVYHLLVFLRPPPGHSSNLELDTREELPGRPSNIHVVLECVCWKKRLLGGCVGFLHQHDNKLPRDRRSFPLQTLCTSSYLDMEKVACWVQLLVTSARQFWPDSHHCQLLVLPSSASCQLQLTSTAGIHIFSEMFLA
ncbi:IPIL1 protein, partial [Thinocorus orbignyianus]|nr:IPIL1 protein [Thinocorus orbignyianus]